MRAKNEEEKKKFLEQKEQKYKQDLLDCQNNIDRKQSERDKINEELNKKNEE